jgi:acyl-CoA synthetase (AMP-forming)/AMP-acid ligase II/alkylation response protein AidB-like acyl-CoA dehydrogenase/acyl carrier protein
MNIPSGRPTNLTSLVALLQWRAEHQATQLAYRFLKDGEWGEAADGTVNELTLTYGELDLLARAIAARLQGLNLKGERAVLLYPPGLGFIAAFWGCLYAGVVAVPAYPPRPNRSLQRIRSILQDAQPKVALSESGVLATLEHRLAEAPELKVVQWLTSDSFDQGWADGFKPGAIASDQLAFLQYTSGSTALPKGVMISHKNLLHNSAVIQACFQDTPASCGVSWLPPYHDMGLIGGILQPLYVGAVTTLMPPVAFLQKPLRWLKAIARTGATTSGGPNFAYDLCVRKTTPEQRASLDLSTWRLAFSGAEPVQAETLQRFAEAFAPSGFKPSAFYPCYGLAESTLMVTGGTLAQGPMIYQVDAQALQQNRVKAATGEGSRALVSCGPSAPEQQVVIVEPQTGVACAADTVGEIWVADSASIAQGYWQRPEASAETFAARLQTGKSFMRTGDLGFLHDGELFVTGRLKDLIIIRGRNHYPQDIENTVEQAHPALRPGCGAAFSIHEPTDAVEKLVLVYEVERNYVRKLQTEPAVLEDIGSAVTRQVSQQHELLVHALVLVKTGSIPKTSSGKIQRHACRQGFLAQTLEQVGEWPLAESVVPVQLGSDAQVSGDASSAQSQVRANALIAWLRDYASTRINSRIIDERRCMPPYVVLDLGNQGALGMQVSEPYGGLGLSHTDMMRVMEQLGGIDPTISLFVGLNNVLGIRPIMNFGSEEMRSQWLPKLATGRELAAFALTEPGAGSNPQAIATQAKSDGSGRWRLSGTKVWSGSAAWAGVINVFAQQIDEQGRASGLSGFVVPQGAQGLRQGPEALTMGMRGMVQNAIYFDQVPVTASQLLGSLGGGMNAAQDAMMYGRLTIGASSVGGMKRCAQLMLRYAQVRNIATGRLLDNPVTLARLSELTAMTTAVETLIYQVTHGLDSGQTIPVDAYVVCKMAGPEFLWRAADHLVQVLGGRGYVETNIAPQILRDARILRIFEGPTETLQMFLGSRVINSSADLQQFLTQTLGATDIAQALEKAAQAIQDRCGQGALFGDSSDAASRAAALRWAYSLTGQVAMYAVLWAALSKAMQQAPSAQKQRALAWSQAQFDHSLHQALQGSPVESVLLSSLAVTEHISNYRDTIGDIEQTLAGEDTELDPWLRQTQVGQAKDQVKGNAQNHAQNNNGTVPLPEMNGTSQGKPFPREREPGSATQSTPSSQGNRSQASIQAWMVSWLAKELKLPERSISPTTAFADYGLDSVTAVELADGLQEWLGQPLSPTLAYEYPTIEALAQYLAPEDSSHLAVARDGGEADEMAQLLEALEQLPDAEVQKVFAQANRAS